MEEQKQRFYEKTWFAWVMLIFLAPVGIALMFKYQHHTKYVRTAASAFFGIIFIVAIFTGEDESPEVAVEETEAAEENNNNEEEQEQENENNSNNEEEQENNNESNEPIETEEDNNSNEDANLPEEEEEDSIEEVIFDFDRAEYVEDTETFDIEVTTNIPDGTKIFVALRDPHEEHIYNGSIEDVEVEDGAFTTQISQVDDDWDGPFPILNGEYELRSSFSVNEDNNPHLLDTYGSYEDFKENFTIDAEVTETDSGYVVEQINTQEVNISGAWTEEEMESAQREYRRNNAESISFAELDKNADAHFGEYVSYSGTIEEIQEGSGVTQIRLALDGNYNELIFVEYEGYTDFLKDDNVTVYGEIYGDFTYVSQAGWEITLPSVMADHIE